MKVKFLTGFCNDKGFHTMVNDFIKDKEISMISQSQYGDLITVGIWYEELNKDVEAPENITISEGYEK